jgi:hypothetical protein
MPIGNCARRRYPSETVSDDLPIAAQHTAFQHLSRAAGSFFGQPLSLPDARALINEGPPDGIISHRRKPAKHDRRREHCHHALPSCPGLIPFQQLLAIPV